MAILTPADKEMYFPSVELSGGGLIAALRSAQALAEGPLGANRPLEIRTVTQTLHINSSVGSLTLPRRPIVFDEDHPIEIEVRGANFADGFGRPYPSVDWNTLAEDDYDLNIENGQILIKTGIPGLRLRAPHTSIKDRSFLVTPAMQRSLRATVQARVTYSTGFDFEADPLTEEAEAIKAAIAEILKIQTSPIYQGISTFSLDGAYTIGYGTSSVAAAGGIRSYLEDNLQVLRKWRPVTGVR